MYTPIFNEEKDTTTLRQFVRRNPLCALVTPTKAGLVASHIPMVLHEEGEGFGVLRGHVARANMQWREFVETEEAMGIFTGPQHFISASWYPGKTTHGREVPTWNYVAVHVYGKLRVMEEPGWMVRHLTSLTDQNEAMVEKPWRVSDAPVQFIARLCATIVGLELPVTRVEGKWKVSQNRSDEDAAAVREGLAGLGTAASEMMSELIRTRRPG